MWIFTHKYTWIYSYIHTYIHTPTYMHASIHTYMYACIHTHTDIHTYMHACMHACMAYTHTHLLRTVIAIFYGMHLTWKKHAGYTWQEWADERTWKPVKTAIAIVSAKWSEWEADPSPFNKAISLPTWQIAKIVQTLKWPQIGWKKLKLVEKRRGGPWVSHVPWPESKILQVRRDDQSRYPPNSWVASLAVDSWVGHCPLLKLEVLHLFRCFTHTPSRRRVGKLRSGQMRWKWEWRKWRWGEDENVMKVT